MKNKKPLIVGNWKMNGLQKAGLKQLAILRGALEKDILAEKKIKCDVLICPPTTLLALFSNALLMNARRAQARQAKTEKVVKKAKTAKIKTKTKKIMLGAQDCHQEKKGAWTGSISAEMLYDAGARFVILGHSERRIKYKETSKLIAEKYKTAYEARLHSIICIGETSSQYKRKETLETLAKQLKESLALCQKKNISRYLTIAYEPVWAIGTGRIPTLQEIVKTHNFIRQTLVKQFGQEAKKVKILYGGSVKPENASEILKSQNVDGVLVGGASLKARDFLSIIRASL